MIKSKKNHRLIKKYGLLELKEYYLYKDEMLNKEISSLYKDLLKIR